MDKVLPPESNDLPVAVRICHHGAKLKRGT
jgi:hypothetical protein